MTYREAFPSIKWYSLPSPVPEKPTIAEQRNLGIQHSDGDIIVFLDASCVPCTNWLASLVSPIRHEQEYIVAGGVTSTRGPSAYDTAAPHES